MSMNPQLAVFRAEALALLDAYADALKVHVTKNRAMGIPADRIRRMMTEPDDTWAKTREKLIKDMKRAVAGMVNRVHIAAYTREL